MTTNYEWLLQMSGDERQAWFDAPRADREQVDERANLEADIIHWLGSWTAFSVPTSKVKQFIFDCLDRQAAITRAGCDKPNWDYCETCELQTQVRKLRSDLLVSNTDREHWRKLCGELIDKAHEMQLVYDEGLA